MVRGKVNRVGVLVVDTLIPTLFASGLGLSLTLAAGKTIDFVSEERFTLAPTTDHVSG